MWGPALRMRRSFGLRPIPKRTIVLKNNKLKDGRFQVCCFLCRIFTCCQVWPKPRLLRVARRRRRWRSYATGRRPPPWVFSRTSPCSCWVPDSLGLCFSPRLRPVGSADWSIRICFVSSSNDALTRCCCCCCCCCCGAVSVFWASPVFTSDCLMLFLPPAAIWMARLLTSSDARIH